MKKILCLVVSVVLMLSLSACSIIPDNTSSDSIGHWESI